MGPVTRGGSVGGRTRKILAKIPKGISGRMEECIMKTSFINLEGLVPISHRESVCIKGGGEEGWDYELAEYLGMGVGYGLKKLWKALKFASENLYRMRSNPILLYQ